MRLRLSVLFLILLLVGETTLVLHNIERPWWIPPILAMCGAVGVNSVLRYTDRNALFRRAIVATENWILLRKRRSYLSVVSLAAAVIVMIGPIVCTWPPPNDFLSVLVYRERRDPKNFAVGARVLLLSETTAVTKESTVNEKGIARFDDLKVPAILWVQINETRDDLEWSWSPERLVLETLPHAKDYDLASVQDKEWTRIGPSPESALPSTSLTPRTDGREQKGDPAFQAANAPWGVPQAPVVVNRYAYILGLNLEARVTLWAAYALAVSGRRVTSDRQRWAIDPLIPKDMQPTLDDYSGSGYDRGHLISPVDVSFKGRVAAMEASYLSAIAPQVPELNRGVWLRLEGATRNVAERLGRQVFVVDGPLYENPSSITIGASKIPVPSHFFRVVTWIEADGIQWAAHLVANSRQANADVKHSAVAINDIERRTGLTLLPHLEESRVNEIKQTPRPISDVVSSYSGRRFRE